MKELPCLEEIYDFETQQLEQIYEDISKALISGGQCELPKGFESYEKFERKAMKLKDALELELDERKQVDDVISFFVNKSGPTGVDLLNDDQFYQPQQNKNAGKEQNRYNHEQEERVSKVDIESQANTAFDSDSIYSGRQQESQYEQQSEQDQSAASDLSKQMFAKRSSMIKNKKDLQQFMKEKLQKTKVASESLSSAPTTGPQQKNFTKKKTQIEKESSEIGSKKKSFNGTASVTSEKTTTSNIYKPNLRKGTASATSKQVKVDSTPQPKESKKVKAQDNQLKNAQISKPMKTPLQNKKLQKPPISKKTSTSQGNAPQSEKQEETVIEQEGIQEWENAEHDYDKNDEGMLGQEEIASKYSDHEQEASDREQDFNEYNELISPDNQNDIAELKDLEIKLKDIQVKREEKQQVQDDDDQFDTYKNDNNDADNNDTDTNDKQQLLSNGEIEVLEQEINNHIGNEQEIIQNVENPNSDYHQEVITNNDTSSQQELIKEEVSSEKQSSICESDTSREYKKSPSFQMQPDSNRKIRGKVLTYVDDEVISSRVSPRLQTYRDEHDRKSKQLEEEVKQIEDEQEKEKEKQAAIKESKGSELMRKIKGQDENMRKQEQEQRLKEIRDQITKEKESKMNSEAENTQQVQGQKEQVVEPQKTEDQTKKEQSTKSKKDKTVAQKKIKKQGQKENAVSSIPRVQLESEQIVDYSPFYKSFYDIFVGQMLEPKSFDISFVMRETRNMYATFVSIMDNNALSMKKKHQFDQAPTEKSLQDYYNMMPNQFMLTGKSINDLELEMKNRGNDIMMQAMTQFQLRDRFQQIKQKEVTDIIKDAASKTEGANDNNSNNLIDMNRESSLYFRVVKNRSEVYDIISRAFARKRRWNELPHGLDLRNSWNLLWTWSKIKIDLTKLISWQRCNHFNGAKNVSRKDFLKRNVERAQKMSQKSNQVFNILPLTFILPKEYVSFLENFSEFEEKEGKFNFWIMKPVSSSRGRGISLVNDISNITYGEPVVIQRYIKNPLLINGYKFDMRIYVLVTSVNPLEVFLYKEGFGRFSTMPFTLDPTDKNNKYIHLTNVSIQKYNQNNSGQDQSDVIYGGTKVSLQTLKKRIQQANKVSWDDQLWPQMRDLILKSLVACQNDIQYNPCCFELFGFDIMIDTDFKCWLIEINSSPSLARETLLDDMIKQRLIDDTIDLVDPLDFDRKRLFEVLERRINDDFKQNTSANAFAKKTMNRDLTYILNGQVPRKFGEMPKVLGNYERIAPSTQSDYYLKLIGGQKMFGSLMKIPQQQSQ